MTLAEEIISNWETDIPGYIQIIQSLKNTDYQAWTMRTSDKYGVIILYDGNEDIYESFASAKIISENIVFEGGNNKKSLALSTENKEIKEPFSILCAAFIDPGNHGENRKKIKENPVAWWKEWKELLGNKNIDERIYDVLGELCVLKYALGTGEDVTWNGPDGKSYDIEMQSRFLEVKSSTKRYSRQVSISSQFQLYPQEKPLYLILCIFEPVVMSGKSIDSIVMELSQMGYNTELINSKLELLGFEQGMSARKKRFLLHEMLMYTVDDKFPRITRESFPSGDYPDGIVKITYTADLSGLTPTSLLKGASDEIQNN